MIKVDIIRKKNLASLVGWKDDNGIPQQSVVPTSKIIDGHILKEDLELGISYGVRWAELITLRATPELLEYEMKKLGIWTAQDAIDNPNKVISAIQAVYGLELSTILGIAHKEIKRG